MSIDGVREKSVWLYFVWQILASIPFVFVILDELNLFP